ncbi:hypothetical protein GCM10009864_41480 [Streptomyces lunalinharesii]|uniref:Secreted protein n=1 Tax=Streptomyces lunalinharesii TaxID=333384 RepID=A0ABN3S477_9ACTN
MSAVAPGRGAWWDWASAACAVAVVAKMLAAVTPATVTAMRRRAVRDNVEADTRVPSLMVLCVVVSPSGEFVSTRTSGRRW